jgi:two-component system, OmpR family, response regulator
MRLLVVEDEKAVADQISSELTAAGYLVDQVWDGEEAWLKGDTENYAAIILDLGLPKLDGLSVLRRWRASGLGTPVFLVTARATWMERVEGIDAGADDFLPKPFHVEELLARLAAILRRSSGHPSAIICSGAIRIDTRRMIVSVDGRNVAVTPLEFRLIRYLAHHTDRVVPAGELFEHIYASDNAAGSNALEVLVNRLRKKLGPQSIGTRRGHGYFLEPQLG